MIRSRSPLLPNSSSINHGSPTIAHHRAEPSKRSAIPSISPQRRKSLYILLVLLSLGGWLYHSGHAQKIPTARLTSAFKSSTLPFEEQDGLLYSPLSDQAVEHPIVHLIRQGQVEWREKLERQSKTLIQAVAEYKRRYSRDPPKGFDDWYRFAVANNVKLIDEYDIIDEAITPFLGFPPSVLNKRQTSLIDDETNYWHGGSYTIRIKNGKLLDPIGPFADSGRAAEQMDLMNRFASKLPDLNITTWAHDTPIVHTSGDLKAELAEAARHGRFISSSKYDDVSDIPDVVGWEAFCLPSSPLRSYMQGTHINSQPSLPRSFIRDHSKGMNICLHPEYLNLHSLTGNYGIGPTPVPFWPLFSHSKMQLYSDMLLTPMEQYEHKVGPDPHWQEKKFAKMLWRGSTTGSRYDRRTWWKLSQRGRLNTVTNAQEGNRQIMLATPNNRLTVTSRSLADLNAHLFDVAFAGQPIQCAGDGTCEAVQRLYRFTQIKMKQEEANQYKYVMDVDGNGWSGRFHRLMASKSAVLKSTGFVEWYQDRIQPWVHYIPVKIDYSDLHDIMAFFLGDVNGENAHDSAGEAIGQAGQKWAEEHWRIEDMEVYSYRLYLEYARAMLRNEDGSGMDYVG